MQSGTATAGAWVLAWEPAEGRALDPLMGWFGSGDTQSQVQLRFATEAEAVAYAKAQGVHYDLELPQPRVRKPKVYADNFRVGRTENWSH